MATPRTKFTLAHWVTACLPYDQVIVEPTTSIMAMRKPPNVPPPVFVAFSGTVTVLRVKPGSMTSGFISLMNARLRSYSIRRLVRT